MDNAAGLHAFAGSNQVAVGDIGILLHPPLPLAGVSIGTQKGRQQNDNLADGYNQGAKTGPWSATDFEGGTRGGTPLVLYKKGSAGALRTVVMSPLDNFMAATIASPATDLFVGADQTMVSAAGVFVAVGETVILLHPPLPLVGVSIWTKRGCQ